MSRVFFVTSLVLVAFLSLLPSERAVAQFGGGGYGGEGGYGRGGFGGEYGGRQQRDRERSVSTTISDSKAEEKIEAVLNELLKSPLQYEDQPLNEVINTLQDEYDIPIIFDNVALDEVAISPDTEVTINLRNISLRSALNLILKQPGLEDLTYVVSEEVLLITTHERANATLVVQVYRVEDLVNNYSQVPGGNQKNPFSSLSQVISSCVESDSWMTNGRGEGEIKLMQPGMLVVSQTRHVQEQVRELLEKLRETQAEIEGD